MKRTIATILTVLALALMPVGVFGAAASADCPTASSANTPQSQVLSSVGEAGGNCSEDQVTNTISAAVNILSYVAGVAAIIMLILSGFRYITSGGDSSKVAAAKNTLVYALVGIVIAVLAQVLVRYVITQADSANSATSSTSSTPQAKKSTGSHKSKAATGGTSAP
jgi:hypothetical protein